MKVLFLMHYFHEDVVGGAEVQAYLLARELAKRGHRVTYICERIRNDSPREEVRDGIHVLRTIRQWPLFKILNVPLFLLTLLRVRPDVVYQRYASQYTFMGGLARLFGVRFVWGCSEDKSLLPRFFTNVLRSHLDAYKGSVIKRSALRLDAWLSDRLFAFGCTIANTIIVQNVEQQGQVQKRFGKCSILMRSGHSTAVDGAPAERFEVLWLAALREQKQPELFLELAAACSDVSALFVMAGRTANKGYQRELEEKISALPNAELRHVDTYHKSQQEYARASVYVSTSSGEGFPNAFIQAWMHGVPVISLNIDPDNVIAEHRIGFVCSDIKEMAGKVRLLATSTTLRREMGERARMVARKYFSIDTVIEQFEIVLNGEQQAVIKSGEQ